MSQKSSHGPTVAPALICSLLTLIFLVPGSVTAATSSVRSACSSWISRPIGNFHDGAISGFAAISPNDVWAVGTNNNLRPVAEHWNGHAWSIIPVPAPAGDDGELVSASGVASNDVWAVGTVGPAGLIEHWNGTAWRLVELPNLAPAVPTYVNSVTAIGANDAWAVGNTGGDVGSQFILHWNGRSWALWQGSRRANDYLDTVKAAGPDDIWAAGDASEQPLIEHWNGKTWSVVPTPRIAKVDVAALGDLAVVTPSDIWAVGFGVGNNPRSIIEHWNGKMWSLVPSHTGSSELNAVSAAGPNDVWAVGDRWRTYADGGSLDRTMLAHWNGHNWTELSLKETPDNSDGAIQAITSTDVWAGGQANPGVRMIHFNGKAWSPVQAPSPIGGDNQLTGIADSSLTNAWAVGSVSSAYYGTQSGTAWHWNGHDWSTSALAQELQSSNAYISDEGSFSLSSVAIAPEGSAWAVGSYYATTGGSYVVHPSKGRRLNVRPSVPSEVQLPLIEHWTRGKWKIAKQPITEANTSGAVLNDVATVGTSNIWAVGYDQKQALVERWNGASWSVIPTPQVRGSASLKAVSAVSASDVWSVGTLTTHGAKRPLIEHWNGKTWSHVSGVPTTGISGLVDVLADSRDNVWTLGESTTGPVTDHWNGSRWVRLSLPSVPNAKTSTVSFTALAGSTPSDVWAVGSYVPSDKGTTRETLTEHWNGSTWHADPSQSIPVHGSMAAAASLPNGSVWAVGHAASPWGRKNLVEQTARCRP